MPARLRRLPRLPAGLTQLPPIPARLRGYAAIPARLRGRAPFQAGEGTTRHPVPRRVVVVGASMAGLLAAAACAGSGRTVTLLDRDDPPRTGDDGAPLPRAGVPQGRQPHVFLHRGLLAAQTLLPGLRDDLVRRGGVPFDSGALLWRSGQGWLTLGRYDIELVSVTRPLLEDAVRARVLALPGVSLRWGARVDGLERTPGGNAGTPAGNGGTGWRIRAGDETLEADLVVDASGRGSRLPAWLRDLDVPEAPVDELDARMGYATRMYAGGPEILDAPGVAVLATPENPVGGLALLMENGRWLVAAAGFGDLRPPRDNEAFETFLRALPDRAFGDLIARADPMGDVAVYRQTANRRHRYERLPDWPDGLLAVGDAFCTFDPIYGQGITVAALEAVLLRDVVAKAQAEAGLEPGWSAGLLRRFGRIVDLPWTVATGEDRRFLPGNRQTHGQRLLGVWTRRLDRMAAHGDGFARQQLARVYNLLASPAALFHPRLVASAARAVVLGEGEPCPRPASLEALAGAAAPAGP